ncbi:hypothetical protein CP556_14730 [Natrinema sp. CBA1119]|nr:hypothetical protein CP556_14730 [Natrinema sp. CBA1119]
MGGEHEVRQDTDCEQYRNRSSILERTRSAPMQVAIVTPPIECIGRHETDSPNTDSAVSGETTHFNRL